MLRGDVAPSSVSSTSSPSMASSVVLFMSSSSTSACSKPSSLSESTGGADRHGEGAEDLEMEDGCVESEMGDRSRRGEDGMGEFRGRQLGRVRDKMQTQTHPLGLGLVEEGMMV